jgi:hypothetical protein
MIRRLARRGGVKRSCGLIYEDAAFPTVEHRSQNWKWEAMDSTYPLW